MGEESGFKMISVILFLAALNEDSLASDSQPDNAAANEDSWALPEITGRGIIPMASEEELEELQDMVDELLNSDGTDGQTGQGTVWTRYFQDWPAKDLNEKMKNKQSIAQCFCNGRQRLTI